MGSCRVSDTVVRGIAPILVTSLLRSLFLRPLFLRLLFGRPSRSDAVYTLISYIILPYIILPYITRPTTLSYSSVLSWTLSHALHPILSALPYSTVCYTDTQLAPGPRRQRAEALAGGCMCVRGGVCFCKGMRLRECVRAGVYVSVRMCVSVHICLSGCGKGCVEVRVWVMVCVSVGAEECL